MGPAVDCDYMKANAVGFPATSPRYHRIRYGGASIIVSVLHAHTGQINLYSFLHAVFVG